MTDQATKTTTLWVARLHQAGSDQADDLDETGKTEQEAYGRVVSAWMELNDLLVEGDEQEAIADVQEDLAQGNIAIETRCYTIKEEGSDLAERMAMAFFFVGTGDEDNHRLVLRWVRQDDHASIAWLLLSDHTLTTDDEAWELVQAILAGGEAG